MKKSRPFPYVAPLLAFCMFLACQKTDTPAEPAPGKGHIIETVQASIAGRITDDQWAPVAGAIVKAGLTQTTTDINVSSGTQHQPDMVFTQMAPGGPFVL